MIAEKATLIHNVVDAIEAFTQAKISYAMAYAKHPEWANSHDVNETREHLADKLNELIEA